MTDSKPAPVATINKQMEAVGNSSTGVAVAGVRVYFTTAKGVTGYVFVPKDEYNDANVRNAVRERAMTLDALQDSEVV